MRPEILQPLLLSLQVALCATALVVLAGVPLAFALARWRSRFNPVADALLTLPLVLPPTVLGYYLLVLLGREGIIGRWLDAFGIRLVFTWQGAVIAAAVAAFPLLLKAARTAFEGVDPRLEDAAHVLGLSPIAVFMRVSLPLASPGIAAGALLTFARALGEFGATLMLAGNLPGRTQTLSVAIYAAIEAGDEAGAAVLVAIASVTCVLALLLATRLLRPPARRAA